MNIQTKKLAIMAIVLTFAYFIAFGAFTSVVGPYVGFAGSWSSTILFFFFIFIALWLINRTKVIETVT